jgi:hypothetical protein
VVAGAAGRCGGVPVLAQRRRHQHVRWHQRAPHVADSCATPPGTPPIRIRGGDEVLALVGRARWSGGAHTTNRFVGALPYAGEETSRERLAADLSWRPLDMVQGQTLRWRVAVLMQDWTSPEGGSPLTKPPGHEGAGHRVILSLLVALRRFVHPDPQDPLHNHRPADTVGSRRANVLVACWVEVIDERVSSEAPQEQLQRFTPA